MQEPVGFGHALRVTPLLITWMLTVRSLALLVLTAALVLPAGPAEASPVDAASAGAHVSGRPAVVEARIIGRSLKGRAIMAYRSVTRPRATRWS
ncbi:hypothetical protein BH10ACT10_BH10ACT10_04310 [soil metagenome]